MKQIKSKKARKQQKNKTRKGKKGGYMDQFGTTATVYLNPRLLCKGESVKSHMYDEVSKVTTNPNDMPAVIETAKVNLLKEQGVNLNIVQKYLVLPIKTCELSDDNLKGNHPYTDEYFYGINGKKIGKSNLAKAIENNPNMIIYPRLDKNLSVCIDKSNSIDEVYEYLSKLKNVYEGLEYLLQHNMRHGDMKSTNIMHTFDGEMKMIDLGTLGLCSENECATDFKRFFHMLYDLIFRKYMEKLSKSRYDKKLNSVKYYLMFSGLFEIKVSGVKLDYIGSGELNTLRSNINETFRILEKGATIVEEPQEYKEYKKHLNDTTIEDKYYYGENFEGIQLNNKTINTVLFHSCNLNNANISNSKLNYMCFTHTSLEGANFSNSKIRNVDFSHASLVGADFRGVKFINCKFVNADVRDCKFNKLLPFGVREALQKAKNYEDYDSEGDLYYESSDSS